MTQTKSGLNITLIRPHILEIWSSLSNSGATLPLGLAYIAAALRDEGHRLTVIDAPGESLDHYQPFESPVGTLHINGLTPDEVVERIPIDTEIIGITNMFVHEWPPIKEIAEKAKTKVPHAKLIIGGENATAYWKTIFKESDAIDYCVLGEGESAIVELIHRLQLGESIDMQGIRSRHSTETSHIFISNKKAAETSRTYTQKVAAPLSKRQIQVDAVPRPAWEYFPVSHYMSHADRHGVNRGRSMPMLASRGCPYQCTFCSSPAMWTTRYVTRSPQEVVDEMKTYVERYRADNFNFCDLTAIVKKDWIIEFCNTLKKEKLDITWQLPSGTRSEALDKEVLNAVYETGCRNITYAPESGSERMLEIIKKKVKLPRLLASLRAGVRIGLITRVNVIIGHPQEQRADVLKSLWFLSKCSMIGCQDAAVLIFVPYPGSEDTERLISQGKLSTDKNYPYLGLARSGSSFKTYNPHMGTRELLIWQFFMLSVFYITAFIAHPKRFFHLFRSLITGVEETQLDQLIRTKLAQGSVMLKPFEWFRFFAPSSKKSGN